MTEPRPRATRRTVPSAAVAGRRRATAALATIGEQLALARKLRGWTQAELAKKVGIDQTRQSQIERGKGDGVPARLWFAFGAALGVPVRFEFGRDRLSDIEDAGHLDIQDFMLGLARATGRERRFELATRPTNPALSVDVALRDDLERVLILEECWNTFSNVGGSVRTTQRKIAEAEQLAVAVGRESPYRVAACWIVRDSVRNRELLSRYPEVFKATFAGSSEAWVKALVEGGPPPHRIGLVWFDSRQRRLLVWR